MEDLTLTLNQNEVNTILLSLSKQPFEAVVDVIGKVRSQALAQLNPAPANVLSLDESQE